MSAPESTALQTSPEGAGDEGSGTKALQHEYTFWYHRRRGDKKNVDYNESTKQIESFGTIQAFWQIYDHILRPNEFKVTTDYHLFKKGIKPTWEDPANNNGGKWMVRLKKGLASRYWEELVLAIIGEQFDTGDELCGAVVSVRSSEDIISVWNRNSENKDATNKIRDQIRRVLNLPAFIAIEYKKHVDAKADGSSFRNPSMVWKATPRGNEGGAGAGAYNKERAQGAGSREGAGFHGEKRFPREPREPRDPNAPREPWKDRRSDNRGEARGQDRNNNAEGPSHSTGDPARDAANADKANAEKAKGRGVPSTSSWGNASKGDARSNDTRGGAMRRERGGSGEAGAEASSSRSDALPNTFKRAPLPGIPSLRGNTFTAAAKAQKDKESPNVWTRQTKVSEEKD